MLIKNFDDNSNLSKIFLEFELIIYNYYAIVKYLEENENSTNNIIKKLTSIINSSYRMND